MGMKMSRRMALSAVVSVTVLAVVTVSGIVISNRTPPAPPPACAECGPSYIPCTPDQTTRTSAVTVTHLTTDASLPVEPDDTDTFTVAARYAYPYTPGNPTCSCTGKTYTATVEVRWIGSGWSATCTSGCDPNNGPIRSVCVCDVDSCAVPPNVIPEHGWTYKLLVAVDARASTTPVCPRGNISKVDYTVADLDDGNIIDTSDCSEGTAVSYDEEISTGGVTDSPVMDTSRCPWSCYTPGASLTLYYD